MAGRAAPEDEEIARLRNELWQARQAVINMAPGEMRQLLTGYYRCETREDAYRWLYDLIEEVLKRADTRRVVG